MTDFDVTMFDDDVLESAGKLFFDIENLKRQKKELDLQQHTAENDHQKYLKKVDLTEEKIKLEKAKFEKGASSNEKKINNELRKDKRALRDTKLSGIRKRNIDSDLHRLQESIRQETGILQKLKIEDEEITQKYKNDKVALKDLEQHIFGNKH